MRTAWSIASLAATACARVTASGDSRSTGSNASMRAAAPRLPTSTRVAAYSPPAPVEQRQRIADAEADDPRRVMRGGLGKRDRLPDQRRRELIGTKKRGAAIAAYVRSTKSKW